MINWVLNNPIILVCVLLTFHLSRLFYVKHECASFALFASLKMSRSNVIVAIIRTIKQ